MRLCILFLRPLSNKLPALFTIAHPDRNIILRKQLHTSIGTVHNALWKSLLRSWTPNTCLHPRYSEAECLKRVSSQSCQAGSVSILVCNLLTQKNFPLFFWEKCWSFPLRSMPHFPIRTNFRLLPENQEIQSARKEYALESPDLYFNPASTNEKLCPLTSAWDPHSS